MQARARRGRAAPILLSAVVWASACGSGSPEPADASGEGTTTVPATSGVTSLPGTTTPSSTTSTIATTTLAPLEPPTFEALEGIHTIGDFSGLTARGMARWQESVPGIEDITITSTADGSEQPALWLPPDGETARPLLVILHSWSSPYVQHAGIPYAMWAQENGWAVIAPEFRGVNDDADSIGSDLAVQDVVDAIDFATSQEGIDVNRVYAVGYSGGGMMSLLLAGRHPEKVTAVAAWGPPYDLIAFYSQSAAAGRHYAPDIEAGCGGSPTDGGAPEEECVHRSPMTHLDAAKEQGVQVFIGQGIHDSLVSPSQGARAFNQLAASEDQFTDEELEVIGGGGIPDHLSDPVDIETFFGDGDPAPVFARQSGSVLLVFFDADHEMVYQASARWFATDPH